MIKAPKVARYNYLLVFSMCAGFFAKLGVHGLHLLEFWIVALVMVFESFALAMALAEGEK